MVGGAHGPAPPLISSGFTIACLLDACDNRALAAAVLAVVRPGVVHRTFHRYSVAALQRSMAHHREIVAAAEVGDAEWAESVMRTHILAARHDATEQPQT